jgi:hypothetical protein
VGAHPRPSAVGHRAGRVHGRADGTRARRRGLRGKLKATGLGAASSSCSYAAIAKSVFHKGAGLPTAVAFMFASTNVVFELGIGDLDLPSAGWRLSHDEGHTLLKKLRP